MRANERAKHRAQMHMRSMKSAFDVQADHSAATYTNTHTHTWTQPFLCLYLYFLFSSSSSFNA